MGDAARRAKIERLRDGTASDGERMAAEAALERLGPEPVRPAYGTPAYVEAMQEHYRLVGYCSVNRGLEGLTRGELRTILNFVKYGGNPWEDTAAELRAIAAKIRKALVNV